MIGRVGDISRRFSREDVGIVNLAHYPSLNSHDVGGSGDLSRPSILEPRVCKSSEVSEITTRAGGSLLTFQQTWLGMWPHYKEPSEYSYQPLE